MIRQIINRWKNPLSKTVEVVLVCEDNDILTLFTAMLNDSISEEALKTYGISLMPSKDDNLRELRIDSQTSYSFKFVNQILPGGDWTKINLEGDLFVQILCLDKYMHYEYNSLPHEIDGFVGRINYINKKAIVALLSMDKILSQPLTTKADWEELLSKVYSYMQCNMILTESDVELTEFGRKVLNLIIPVVQRYISKNNMSNAFSFCNFFYTDRQNGQVKFGGEEFACNLLMSILAADKHNNFKYLIK